MAEYTIPVKKSTIRGTVRVGFSGMDSLYIPSDDGDAIVEEARERFDLDTLPDGAVLGTVVAGDDPEHHVIRTEWDA